MVETDAGARIICHPRGKKSQAVVGDRVLWQPSEDEGTIESITPRRNLFYRQDELRTKSFAANLDQVLILVAAEPEFSESQLARALIAAEAEAIAPIIALNKRDLAGPFERAWQKLAPYRQMHYNMLALSLTAPQASDLGELTKLLAGKTTLVLGPSGAGKSTLVNVLVPGASALTGEISKALASGKHTTTHTAWYWIDRDVGTALIDSPGFQEFGLQHIEPMRLASLMPDIAAHATQCKFYNCTHLHEPGCGVISAARSDSANGGIDETRCKIYEQLFNELSRVPW